MTDNATRALEIINQLGESIDYLRSHPETTAKLGLDGIRNTVETAHGAATVHALLAIADAIRETGQRGECRSESLRRAHETCIRPAGHDGRHQGTHGSIW